MTPVITTLRSASLQPARSAQPGWRMPSGSKLIDFVVLSGFAPLALALAMKHLIQVGRVADEVDLGRSQLALAFKRLVQVERHSAGD